LTRIICQSFGADAVAHTDGDVFLDAVFRSEIPTDESQAGG
jgi:hypothetical protein